MMHQRPKISYEFIKILTGTDLSSRKLPLIKIESREKKPVVWLTAGVHGDEVGSVVTVQEVFKRIKQTGLLRGSIYAFPLMNPLGFEAASRKLILTEEDINRCFPGKPNGSLAERIAFKIFSTILNSQPNLVIDLHNDWLNSIPYIILDSLPGHKLRETWQRAIKVGFQTRLPLVKESPEFIDEMKKTLTYNLMQQQIPAFTIELGGAYVIDEKLISLGVETIWSILTYLKIVRPWEYKIELNFPKVIKNRILNYSHYPLASKSGFIRFFVKAGQIVKKGQKLAEISDIFGRVEEILLAYDDALVLGYTDSAVVVPGMVVIALGLL